MNAPNDEAAGISGPAGAAPAAAPAHSGGEAARIRVVLPTHLRRLAQIDGEVTLEVPGAVTQQTVLDTLEARYPMLRGTIRDYGTRRRRDFVRFFACQEDLSHEPADAQLPDAVVRGEEPFLVIGAVAGG